MTSDRLREYLDARLGSKEEVHGGGTSRGLVPPSLSPRLEPGERQLLISRSGAPALQGPDAY